MKKTITLHLLILLSFFVKGQTNVSGVISSNTTWTKANSPYIVVNTVSVSTNVTLTIEPGVTVKFDNGKLLYISGTLIALGTSTDSITFTSNSASPYPGIWQTIYLNPTYSIQIEYCIFKYASEVFHDMAGYNINWTNPTLQHLSFYYNGACFGNFSGYSNLKLRHSLFYNNTNCSVAADIDSCIFINNYKAAGTGVNSSHNITNSNFIGNTIGIDLFASTYVNYVTNCIFINNQVAIITTNSTVSARGVTSNSIFCGNGIGYYDQDGSGDLVMNCNFSHNRVAVASNGASVMGNIFTDNDTAITINITSYWTAFIPQIANNYVYHNQVGIMMTMAWANDHIKSNNYVCNNTLYNLVYKGSVNLNADSVCWCDTNSVTIHSKIYDGYVNPSYGFVNFSPYIHCDSSVILALPPIICPTVVSGIEDMPGNSAFNSITVYPNPVSGRFNISINKNIKNGEVVIYDMLGKEMVRKKMSGDKMVLEKGSLEGGVYFVRVSGEDRQWVQKIIVE